MLIRPGRKAEKERINNCILMASRFVGGAEGGVRQCQFMIDSLKRELECETEHQILNQVSTNI